MFVYLAHPIDQSRPDQKVLRTMISEARDLIADQGHTAFMPGQSYQVGYPESGLPRMQDLRLIDQINLFALSAADVLVALLPADVATLGVPAEIEAALKDGTPVVIVASLSLIAHSVQIANWGSRGAVIVSRGDEIDLSHAARLAADRDRTEDQVRELLDVGTFADPDAKIEGRVVDTGALQVRYDPAAKPLSRAHDSDAGLDLATLEDATVAWGVRTLIRTGVYAPPPDGWWGLIKARSSTQARGIQVNEAVIDAGYQGELMISVTLTNTGHSNVMIPAGSRLAQYILIPTFPGKIAEVAEFGPSLRGDRGWGSSGE